MSHSRPIRWSEVGAQWGERPRQLLKAVRPISKDLGHKEIICTEHLLLAMLVDFRPKSMTLPKPDWSFVQTRMKEFCPPWDPETIVLSPGGQTPRVKRILERAHYMATDSNELVEVDHIWAAMCELEPELVSGVLNALEMEH